MVYDARAAFGSRREASLCFFKRGLCMSRGFAPRDAAEHRAGHEARASGIVEIEETADELPRGVETANRPIGHVEDVRGRVDLQSTERECDATCHRVCAERRFLDRVRPVRLLDREARGAA